MGRAHHVSPWPCSGRARGDFGSPGTRNSLQSEARIEITLRIVKDLADLEVSPPAAASGVRTNFPL